MGNTKIDGKKLLDDIKSKTNKETKMKNNNKKVAIFSVVITLLAVATIISSFVFGMNYQKAHDKEVSDAKASALVSKQ